MKKLIGLFLISSNNLVEINMRTYIKTGIADTPLKKALCSLIGNKKHFQILCKNHVEKMVTDEENPGCMCRLDSLYACAQVLNLGITKHTETVIRHKFRNSKCTCMDGNFFIDRMRKTKYD